MMTMIMIKSYLFCSLEVNIPVQFILGRPIGLFNRFHVYAAVDYDRARLDPVT